MKNFLLFSLVILATLYSCGDQEFTTFDVDNGDSLATFQDPSPETLIFNPAADTDQTYTIAVSTLSTSDRSVALVVNDSSTIDMSLLNISTLNPTIAAGEFTTDITITTPAGDVFPEMGGQLLLDLVSVDGAEIDASRGSILRYEIGFSVECPSTDVVNVVGTATTTDNSLLVAFGLAATDSDPRTVLAGPGENQVTIVGGFGTASSEDIILNINPDNGNITDGSPDGTLIFVNGGTTDVPITGLSGRALTCINQISIAVQNAVFAAPNDEFTLQLVVSQ